MKQVAVMIFATLAGSGHSERSVIPIPRALNVMNSRYFVMVVPLHHSYRRIREWFYSWRCPYRERFVFQVVCSNPRTAMGFKARADRERTKYGYFYH